MFWARLVIVTEQTEVTAEEHSTPVGVDSVTGIEFPAVAFPEALNKFERAVNAATRDATAYEHALEVCLPSRAAWLTCYDDWQFFGKVPEPLIRRFESVLGAAERIVSQASHTVDDPARQDRLTKYLENIRFRAELLKVLESDGPSAVLARIDERRTAMGYTKAIPRPTDRVPKC